MRPTLKKVALAVIAMLLGPLAVGAICKELDVVIDPALAPQVHRLKGLAGGPARDVGVVHGGDGKAGMFVLDEIIFQPESQEELHSFLDRFGGTILRSTRYGGARARHVGDQGEYPPTTADPSLLPDGFLIAVDPAQSPLDDLPSLLETAGVKGTLVFSSERAARLLAIALSAKHAAPNLLLIPDMIPEHPDGSGGNIDSSTFWWFTEDDDPTTPGDQGLSTGVIRAWEYVRYKGFPPPPPGGNWQPPIVTIVDCGFDLDPVTGAPNHGNTDYVFAGEKPRQWDFVDEDGTAAGPCDDRHFPWHGQAVFGIAAAREGNSFGSAGTGGPVAIPQLYRTDISAWQVGDAIADAGWPSDPSIVNLSLHVSCYPGWLCEIFKNIRRYITGAMNYVTNNGGIVVAAAGNDGEDLTGGGGLLCNLSSICVGAVDSTKRNVYNYGAPVDIWAPTRILSTITPTSAKSDANDVGIDELAAFGGTSASTPFVSGVVALMKTLNPRLYEREVLSILQRTANKSPDPRVARGYVDAYRAVVAVSPNQPPVVSIVKPTEQSPVPWLGTGLQADVDDPEAARHPPGAFRSSVTYVSDVQGPLCSSDAYWSQYWCMSPQLQLGPHVITAIATDAFGAEGRAAVRIEVVNRPPSVDIWAPDPNGTYFTHQPIDFAATPYDPDGEWNTLSVTWVSDIDGALGTGISLRRHLSQGTHLITTTVTDGLGLTSDDTVSITVLSGAGFPSVRILSPLDWAMFLPQSRITLIGAAIDPEDGPLTGASLQWSSSIDGPLGIGESLEVVLSGPAEPCNPEEVQHLISLRAVDSDGNAVTTTIHVLIGIICGSGS